MLPIRVILPPPRRNLLFTALRLNTSYETHFSKLFGKQFEIVLRHESNDIQETIGFEI